MAVQQLGDLGARLDLVMRQGATFGPLRVHLKQPGGSVVDLTGATLRASVRRRPADPPLEPISITVQAPPSRGFFSLGLTKEQTERLGNLDQRRYDILKLHWDLELEDANGFVRPMFWGEVQVHLGGRHAG